jgi:3'-phosphoadenosine 5'-phosphosulfate sulfotransferase (PAPS reductase)/FAD synthetase
MEDGMSFNIFRELPACMHQMFDNKMHRYFEEQGKPFPLVVLNLSGGKDSTYCLLQMIDQGLPLDLILFCDIGWEFPGMYDHIRQLAAYVREHRPEVPFVHLKPKKNVDDLMGKYLWPSGKNRYCTAHKKATIRRFYSQKIFSQGFEVIEVIGYAAEEEDRMIDKRQDKRHSKIWNVWFPMNKWEWNTLESEALEFCKAKGFNFSDLYDLYHRVSCYLCPQSSKDELRVLRQSSPDLWQEMLDKERRTPQFKIKDDGSKVFNTFKWGKTLHEIDEMFAREEGSTLFDIQYTKKVRKPKLIAKKGKKNKPSSSENQLSLFAA